MAHSRKMVQNSYEMEITRQLQTKNAMNRRQMQVDEAMQLAQKEFDRIQEKENAKKNKGSSLNRKKKSTSKGPVKPFAQVKSRLYQSIESSRKKATSKYENAEVAKRVEFQRANTKRPDEEQSFGSRFFSQSKRKRELEDGASMATSTKNNGAGTDRKIFAVNQNISNAKSINTNRKTVMFKQPLKYYDKSQGSMENIQKPVMQESKDPQANENMGGGLMIESPSSNVNKATVGTGVGISQIMESEEIMLSAGSVLKLGGQPPRFENGAVATGILKNYNTSQWLYSDSRHILLNSHNNYFGAINY